MRADRRKTVAERNFLVYNLLMKTVLITGGSRGIGAAAAKKFAQQGYTVLLNYNRSKQQAQDIRNAIVAQGGDAHLYCADISDTVQVREMFLWVQKYFKKLDVLVNNAGIALTKQLQDVQPSDFDAVMSVNARGMFFCCQQAYPLLKNSGGAAIVNISSVWGLYGASCESVYAMSKHAAVGLSKSLAEELAPTVAVNCLCPSFVYTDMCGGYSQQEIDDFCARYGKKAYSPQQVAEEIYQLAVCGKTGVIKEM